MMQTWRYLFIFMSLFFLPSFLFVALSLNSLAPGLMASSGLILLVCWPNAFKPYNKKFLIVSLCIVSFLSFQSLYLFVEFDSTKPIYSITWVILLFISWILSREFLSNDFNVTYRSLFIILCVLFFLGWLKLFYVPDFFSYQERIKPVFPFSEESHFGLIVGTLSVSLAAVARTTHLYFILVNIISLCFLFPSLSLLMFGLLVIFVCFLRASHKVLFLVYLFIPTIFFVSLIVTNDYFISRISLVDSENLTALVYLQGWLLIYEVIVNGHIFGLGFQMLGSYISPTPEVSETINRLTGRYMNLSDGGFLASKIISEFGVIGILAVLYYLRLFLRSAVFILEVYNKKLIDNKVKVNLIAHGVVLSFFVEMFFRGYGYFSPSLVFLIAFLLLLVTSQKKAAKLIF